MTDIKNDAQLLITVFWQGIIRIWSFWVDWSSQVQHHGQVCGRTITCCTNNVDTNVSQFVSTCFQNIGSFSPWHWTDQEVGQRHFPRWIDRNCHYHQSFCSRGWSVISNWLDPKVFAAQKPWAINEMCFLIAISSVKSWTRTSLFLLFSSATLISSCLNDWLVNPGDPSTFAYHLIHEAITGWRLDKCSGRAWVSRKAMSLQNYPAVLGNLLWNFQKLLTFFSAI